MPGTNEPGRIGARLEKVAAPQPDPDLSTAEKLAAAVTTELLTAHGEALSAELLDGVSAEWSRPDQPLTDAARTLVTRVAAMTLTALAANRGLTAADRAVLGLAASQANAQSVAVPVVISAVRMAHRTVLARSGAAIGCRTADARAAANATAVVAARMVRIAEDLDEAIRGGYERIPGVRRGPELARTRSRFLEDLLAGTLDDDDAVIAARPFGVDLTRPAGLVLLMSVDDSADTPRLWSAALSLSDALGPLHLAVVADIVPHSVFVVPGGADPWSDTRRAFADAIRRLRLGAVLAPPTTGARALHLAYRRACDFLTVARRLHRNSFATDIGELVIYELLASGPAELRDEYVNATLGPLLNLPLLQRAPILEVLDALRESDARTTTAALMLGVHSNTIRYRLGRLIDITGLRYDIPSQRFRIDLAMILLRLG